MGKEKTDIDDTRDQHETRFELSQLFETHNSELIAVLRRRLGSESEAWEVAQEAYVRILQLDRPGTINFLRGYLFKTATNLAINRIRDRGRVDRRRDELALDDQAHELDPFREVSSHEAVETLRCAIAELPSRQRRAFVLRRLHGLNGKATCQALGISERQLRQDVRNATLYCLLRLDGLSAERAQSRLSHE